MTDHFDDYFFASNLSNYVCPTFDSFQCVHPNACAHDSHTGKEYCCDYNYVCWTIASQCADDGSTLSCGDGEDTWCCLYETEVCTSIQGQINICFNSAHDTLTNISSQVLNETYSSLSSAAPLASSWTFNPEKLIAATQTSSKTTTTSISTLASSLSSSITTSSTVSSASSQTSLHPSSGSASSSSSPLSGGAIAGIVIGALVGIALLLVMSKCLLRKHNKQKKDATAQIGGNPIHEAEAKVSKQRGNQTYYAPARPPQELPTDSLAALELYS